MKTMKTKISRRTFIKSSGIVLALPTIITSNALGGRDGTPPASQRITLGGIGMGGRGSGNIRQLMTDKRVQFIAACDVKHNALRGWKDNKNVDTYFDYRELIARDDIDMIMCGTPDHWHAQVTIDAMKAGKDVFCEKPLTLTIGEGRKMVETARTYGRVFSSGSQRVIGDYGRMASAARSGRYGKILEGHANPGGPPRRCYLPGVPIPPNTIEWDLWLGPAPWVPYHPYRCGSAYGLGGQGFRTWYDYSGGMMTDWGGHKFGGAMHGMGVDHTGPTEIKYPDGKEYQYLTYIFKNGMKLIKSNRQGYMCEKGWAEPWNGMPLPPPGLRWYEDGARSPHEDCVNCIIERRRPFRDVEYAHRVATVCHLGNICFKLKRDLKWNPDKEEFIDDEEANRLVDRPRRGPWQI
jgi:hypothetical protein